MKINKLIIIFLLFVSCQEKVVEEKEIVKESSTGEPEQRYPWNCSEGEIEYFESLIELKDESNSN